MNDYYIYIYLDSRKQGEYLYGNLTFDYEPFYVGKGRRRRLTDHLTNSQMNYIAAEQRCIVLNGRTKANLQIDF